MLVVFLIWLYGQPGGWGSRPGSGIEIPPPQPAPDTFLQHLLRGRPHYRPGTLGDSAEAMIRRRLVAGDLNGLLNGADTLMDINGDGFRDVLVEYYGSSGVGIKNVAEVVLYHPQCRCFPDTSQFVYMNPAFDSRKKLVWATYNTMNGHAQRMRWHGTKPDLEEEVLFEIRAKQGGETQVVHRLTNFRTGRERTWTSPQIDLPAGYPRRYKAVVRKDAF